MDDPAAAPQSDGRRIQRRPAGQTTRLRQVGQGGRTARLRLVLDHRAPLPARGLRGHPQRHPAVDVDRRPPERAAARHDVQRRAAVEPAASGRGLLHAAQPVGAAAILGVGRGTVPREVLHLNDKGVSIGSHDNPDQAADDDRNRRSSRSRWRSSGLALDQESFSYEGESLPTPGPGHSRPGLHGAGAHAGPTAALPLRDLAGRHQPADPRLRARRRSRRRVLEPALLASSSGSGTRTASATPPPTRRRTGRPRDKRMLVVVGPHRGHHEKAIARRPPQATTSSGSSSARTAGAADTWATTASRPSRA